MGEAAEPIKDLKQLEKMKEELKKGYKFLNKDGEEMGIFKNPLALVYFMPVALPNRLFY